MQAGTKIRSSCVGIHKDMALGNLLRGLLSVAEGFHLDFVVKYKSHCARLGKWDKYILGRVFFCLFQLYLSCLTLIIMNRPWREINKPYFRGI
jgi:hypothetical protein